jgi:hypothetical protein
MEKGRLIVLADELSTEAELFASSRPGTTDQAQVPNRPLRFQGSFDCSGWRAFIVRRVLEDERARATLH